MCGLPSLAHVSLKLNVLNTAASCHIEVQLEIGRRMPLHWRILKKVIPAPSPLLVT
jgi:hypothetical protein